MRIYVTKGAAINRSMLIESGHSLVNQPMQADVAIAWKMSPPGIPFNRTILMQSEPPVAPSRLALYARHHAFLAVFCYRPELPREYALTGTPAYPYRPAFDLWDGVPVKRKRTGTGIYFAGRRSNLPDGDYYGGTRQYHYRARMAERLVREFGGWCFGQGWPNETKEGRWHTNKVDDVFRLDPDYMYCAENCKIENYVSEKFWDGALCGRPMIYSGWYESEIEWKPTVNHEAFGAMWELSDTEYTELAEHARAWAMDYRGAWENERDKRTQDILGILEGET